MNRLYKREENNLICIRVKENGEQCLEKIVQCDWCDNYLCPSYECIPEYMIYTICQKWPRKQHTTCKDCNVITCSLNERCKQHNI